MATHPPTADSTHSSGEVLPGHEAVPFHPPAMALTVVKGFCMGAADIVPGVSGGTVALVFGIYERLVNSIGLGARALGALARGRVGRAVELLGLVRWWFLIPLAVGVLAAIALLSSVIEGQLHDRPEEMAGLFFGLVVGSVVVAWRLLGDRNPTDLALMLGVGVAAFVLLGFQSGPAVDPPLLAYLGAGAVAICAMILPGISGAFLLLMMGMYAAVLGAVHDTDLAPLALFMVGAVVGLALFSTLLNWLLEHYHDPLVSALIGLMIGSLRVLWPWPHGVGIISEDAGESISGTGLELPASAGDAVVPVLAALGAAVLVIGVSLAAERRHHA